ncbi:MAG: DHH family phosphoesterase, partial [Candidatus Nanohaloarchaeota archaeon]|nr:DHH family phosphoesterase [Candidatus Nanohaloarchaeota archaeon]
DNLKEYEYLEKELSKLVKECLKNREETQSYVLCKVKSDKELKSEVANKLSFLYPSKTIILVHDKGDDNYYISFRNQSMKVNLGKLIREVCSYFEKEQAQGGGHIPAAGAVVKKNVYSRFMERFLQKLKKEEIKTH